MSLTIWQKIEVDFEIKEGAEKQYPSLIQRLLVSRGFTDPQTWDNFLASKPSQISSPSTLLDIEKAVERIRRAFVQKEKIAIYADFDLDGTPGLALMLDGLKQMGFGPLIPMQASRLKEGYGFHAFKVDELHALGVTLIITVDVGITGFEACDRAQSLNIDVIVTDHHQIQEKIPSAVAVINPNRPDCQSGLGYLCGTGVAFYLLRAVKRDLVNQALISEADFPLKSVLDLVAIATITDMVPMIGDNRALVRQGIQVLNDSKRPGLQALMKAVNLKPPLSVSDIGIRLAPKLNALSRMEHVVRPIDILVAQTYEDAENLVEEALKQNIQRVELQSFGERECHELLKDWPYKNFVFVYSEKFHRGVVGLIASKIAGITKLPTYIGFLDASGVIGGSSRSPGSSGINVLKGLEAGSQHLTQFGGHPQAAGFELEAANAEKFIKALADHFDNLGEQAASVSLYDEDLKLSQITEAFYRWLEVLSPFGVGFAHPLFRISGVTLFKSFKIKGEHLKMTLVDPLDRTEIEALYFSAPPDLNPKAGTRVSILGEIQKSSFGKEKKLQILVREMRTQ